MTRPTGWTRAALWAFLFALAFPAVAQGQYDQNVPAEWRQPAEPKIILWAAPGELHLDPMTGKAFNPFVKDRDWSGANSVWSSADKTIRLAGARNEVLGFQLIIQAAGEDLRYVNVQAGELAGQASKVPAGNFKLFRVWYTEVTEPSRTFAGGFNALGVPSLGTGWYGDALIPFGTRFWSNPLAVPKGRNQSVWVDLSIPKGTPAGKYQGRFTVTADRAKPAEVAVELAVWDFDIPDRLNARAEAPFYRGTIPGAWGINERDERALKLERQYFRLARAHRFSAYVYDTWPDVVANPPETDEADLKIDWTFYDKRFGQYLDGSAFDDRLPMEQWYVAIDTGWPSPRDWADRKSEAYYARIEKAIRAYDEHFTQKGWKPRCMYVFFQGLDEPSREDQFVKIKKIAEAVHRGSKRVKMRHDFYTAFANPAPLVQRFGDVMDIWNISGCFYPVAVLQEQQKKGKEAWFYQGAEPWIGAEDIDNDALGLRSWAWIGWKYRVDCWHNWCSGRWSSENILAYPGSYFGVDDLFGSIRLKAYRRGNTDYEYFVMLKELHQPAQADEIVNSIIKKALGEAGNDTKLIGKFGDWSHDVDAWESARAKLAEAIVAARANK
jgi:hypothetical protein